jgi:DNA-binding NarL/FixJ family response regulator
VIASKSPTTGKGRRRILVVDDHPITRHGLTQLISHEPDLVVCGEADSASRALAAIESLKPDLVLADISMPGKSGLALIKDMQALHRDVPVLVMSMHDETIFAERVLRAGGRGYIMKSEGGLELLKAVRQVLQGKVYLSEKMSDQILDVFTRRRPPSSHSELGLLTDREFEVFELIGQGLTTREISQRLHLSPKTVDTHRLHIKEKLQLRNVPELMKYAVRWAATQDFI